MKHGPFCGIRGPGRRRAAAARLAAATETGAELIVRADNPNTVRYRLRRVEAGTAQALANPGHIAELVTAVPAWGELPHG